MTQNFGNDLDYQNDFEEVLDYFNIKNHENFKIKNPSTILNIDELPLKEKNQNKFFHVFSPIDQKYLASIKESNIYDYGNIVDDLKNSQKFFRLVPAPKRGDLIRQFGNELRTSKTQLAKLVSIETGKILQESLGEVQEMIDICDFSVGLSRQLYGLTMPSERSEHRIQEIWHPLGVVGVVTSFNFPVAVWSWNFTLSTICGNTTIWKPSPKTPLTAMACYELWQRTIHKSDLKSNEKIILKIAFGDKFQSEWISKDKNISLVCLTGSTEMGRNLGTNVTKRFGRLLMELGGNNAMIVTPTANINLALKSILFSSVGTCGQRCTTLRRLIVHSSIYDEIVSNLKNYYDKLPIGNPLEKKTLVGPIINKDALEKMQKVLVKCKALGGNVFGGEQIPINNGFYVKPAIVEFKQSNEIIKQETFAPILYVVPYDDLDTAIEIQNDVPQGLSSCIFSENLIDTEKFISVSGSDCGIVNINIGPSGAEIGGAFGGEKETGGGRESGSDSWKNYMRRMTLTTNFSSELPLSQGIEFTF